MYMCIVVAYDYTTFVYLPTPTPKKNPVSGIEGINDDIQNAGVGGCL